MSTRTHNLPKDAPTWDREDDVDLDIPTEVRGPKDAQEELQATPLAQQQVGSRHLCS